MEEEKYNMQEEEIEHLLIEGVSLEQDRSVPRVDPQLSSDAEDEDASPDSDVQGACGLFAEAAQDMATAALELSLGRHFACVDYCNQVAEKSAQAVSLLKFGRRVRYDHDLHALGSRVGAPPEILAEMEKLTPFHPEAFYMDTPPEEADEVINAEDAARYVEGARKILRWARNIVLSM
jgi:HEPN domain-containing protein